MNVLDIDLDFFLDRRPMRPAKTGRPSQSEFNPWLAIKVEEFLTQQCNLRKDRKTPGSVVTHHHDLFDLWKSLRDSGQLRIPFHLTHIDSHADMGMGDTSHGYIMGELLHHDLSIREHPKRDHHDGLLEGNFLSFAVACRWISSIVYVHHPDLLDDNCGIHDIPDCFFRGFDPNCNVLQLKRLPPECQQGVRRMETFEPLALEPEVPIRILDRDYLHTTDSFSFVFVAQSPRYTPVTSDPLLETIRGFIRARS